MGQGKIKIMQQIGFALLVAALSCGPLLSSTGFADDDKTAASLKKDGEAELPSLGGEDSGVEFRPENDPNMIDSEGDSPDSNSGSPLPTGLESIFSVRRQVGEVLMHGFSPQRLPSSEPTATK